MTNPETVLILCAHPDDEILGVGGTIAQYTAEGKMVRTVIFSKGEGSHPWMREKVVHTIRMQESMVAGHLVGTDETIFLGLRDGQLTKDCKDPSVAERIKAIILRYKPDKIFTHDMDDLVYPDHKAVNKVVLTVVDELMAKNRWRGDVYTFNIWFMNFRKTLKPKLVVDISSTFRQKRKALRAFKSQKIALLQLIPFVYAKAFFDGLHSDVRFAETFYKVR
ncbi:MAG: PIG-L deacetylase family protein [Nanoarchaeota archaeon]